MSGERGAFSSSFSFKSVTERRNIFFLILRIQNTTDGGVMQRYKSWILPIAILLGLFFHEQIAVLSPVLPYLIFIMLFFSFNALDVRKMRVTMFDIWLLLFQIVVSTVCYFIIRPLDDVVAQGTFLTILAPTASAAIAVSLILGADIAMMSTYLMLCNIMVAIAAPLSFTLIGASPDISFWQSFLTILAKVFPLLILPFLLAMLTRFAWPKANEYINKHKNASFYVWAVSLTIVIARAIGMIINNFNEQRTMFMMMVATSIFACALQFWAGKKIGKRYGDSIAGGQALGQKNTVLAIWMAQNFLNPLSCIVPTLYVVWQNLFNSYQMMMKERADRKK